MLFVLFCFFFIYWYNELWANITVSFWLQEPLFKQYSIYHKDGFRSLCDYFWYYKLFSFRWDAWIYKNQNYFVNHFYVEVGLINYLFEGIYLRMPCARFCWKFVKLFLKRTEVDNYIPPPHKHTQYLFYPKRYMWR